MHDEKKDSVRRAVRERYAEAAQREEGFGCGPECCTPGEGGAGSYSKEELDSLPAGSHLGLGSGNPIALASLRPGEVVLDLGSGAGVDCFLAANAVGPEGRVIGVDMTPEMISRARNNARRAGVDNVEFRLGEIERLPLADSSVDVIVSNCVINLSPEKAGVFRDAYRVLRAGGRLAVSDMVALTSDRNEEIDPSAYAGCIAGAATVPEIESFLQAAGFEDIRIHVFPRSIPGAAAASATIEARKRR
jgi:SAM-dependent methyltransferase